jgi:hypothetical protein
MFIAHYKNTKSSKEFYSDTKEDLNFPTQVVYKGERYLLYRTIQVSSSSQFERILSSTKDQGVECNVKID